MEFLIWTAWLINVRLAADTAEIGRPSFTSTADTDAAFSTVPNVRYDFPPCVRIFLMLSRDLNVACLQFPPRELSTPQAASNNTSSRNVSQRAQRQVAESQRPPISLQYVVRYALEEFLDQHEGRALTLKLKTEDQE